MNRLALLPLLLCLGCPSSEPSPFVQWLPSRGIVVAHRGGAALAPENTVRAIQTAQRPGIDAEIVEIDLHSSADGEIVVIHDRSVDRVTGAGAGCGVAQDTEHETFGELLVHEMTVEQLAALDAGACFVNADGISPFANTGVTIPTLREVLTTFPSQRFMLEIKQTEPPIVDAVLALVDELAAFERSCFLAFDEQTTLDLAAAAPEEACISMPASGIRCWSTEGLFPFGGGGCPTYDVMWMPHTNTGLNLKRQRIVDNVHDAGMPVFMWTLNEAADLEAAIALSVDGVITDHPDVARGLLPFTNTPDPEEESR